MSALEKAKEEKVSQGEIDTYAKVATVKLYDRKVALVAADMLNDKVVPMYDQYGIPLMRILTDRGTEYCVVREHYEYQLYLAIENIDHTKTKAKSPQTNGICERFHRTMQEEFYATAFRKKIYTNIEQLQHDVDVWLQYYNNERPHSGKYCYGKTPMQTWNESIHLAKEKMLETLNENCIPSQLSCEVETGSAGEQPVSNNPTGWNGRGGENTPSFPLVIPVKNDLKNPIFNT